MRRESLKKWRNAEDKVVGAFSGAWAPKWSVDVCDVFYRALVRNTPLPDRRRLMNTPSFYFVRQKDLDDWRAICNEWFSKHAGEEEAILFQVSYDLHGKCSVHYEQQLCALAKRMVI